MFRLLILPVLALLSSSTLAKDKPPAFTIPDSTLSPNHHFGVSVPTFRSDQRIQTGSNELIEMATGKAIVKLEGDTIFSRANHEKLLPSRWSPDGKLLLWEVDGKWFPSALLLVRIEPGKVSQYNLLEMARKAILTETKKASPEKYEATKKKNAGNGSAYPEGFSVDVEALDPIAFPLHLRIALTANPKGMEDFPDLDAAMDAVLTAEGKLEIIRFKLEPGVSRHF